MIRVLLLVGLALPAIALGQTSQPAPDQMIAPAPCIDNERKICEIPSDQRLACDVCNPIVPGQPMSTELVTEAPYDPLHHPSKLERKIQERSRDLAHRPLAPKL